VVRDGSRGATTASGGGLEPTRPIMEVRVWGATNSDDGRLLGAAGGAVVGAPPQPRVSSERGCRRGGGRDQRGSCGGGGQAA
jgi:hypothetical protein